MNIHADVTFIAGDDWTIQGTLQDATGAPYNLNGVTVMWTMVNQHNQQAIAPADITITIVNALQGTITITVDNAKTSPVAAGRYTDALRINDRGQVTTMWTGNIAVGEDPFRQSLAPAPAVAMGKAGRNAGRIIPIRQPAPPIVVSS